MEANLSSALVPNIYSTVITVFSLHPRICISSYARSRELPDNSVADRSLQSVTHQNGTIWSLEFEGST